MAKKFALTYDGIKDLEDELKLLKGSKRKEVAEKIKEARAQGDLSENAEYDAAKDEQARMEARIAVIENMLRNAEVIDDDDTDSDTVGLGSKVVVFDEEFQEELHYHIVGSAEANPEKGRVSNESPLGVGLIGKKAGETIEVHAPAGVLKFKILEIL